MQKKYQLPELYCAVADYILHQIAQSWVEEAACNHELESEISIMIHLTFHSCTPIVLLRLYKIAKSPEILTN